MVKDHIMDSDASFHANYCKEELERFKLRSGKVRLADDKTLDIAGIGDVVLKTSFGTSWTLKDVTYIPSLKRRLILIGQLDEEGYHVGFGDQQWKVTKGSLVVAHVNKSGSLYMVEVNPEGIGTIINGSGSAVVWFGEAEESFLHNVSEDKETTEVGESSYRRQWPYIYCINLRIRTYDTGIERLLQSTVRFKCNPSGEVRSHEMYIIGSGSDECVTAFGMRRVTIVIQKQRYTFGGLILLPGRASNGMENGSRIIWIAFLMWEPLNDSSTQQNNARSFQLVGRLVMKRDKVEFALRIWPTSVMLTRLCLTERGSATQVNPDSMIAQELYAVQRSIQRLVQVRYTLTIVLMHA
ncbi:hypothetical protein Tco_0070789 [Tanacetum coccineum]